MAPAKATPFVLLLTLGLSFVLASSAAARQPQGPGSEGFFSGIPWFGGGQPRGGGGGGSGFSGGWGAGGVGPGGGFARRGVVQPSTVCGKGPCYNKRLTCPSKCFSSYSYKGKNSAGGGGSGGCSFDCASSCQAHC